MKGPAHDNVIRVTALFDVVFLEIRGFSGVRWLNGAWVCDS